MALICFHLRIAFLIQNQLSSLYRMEGEVGEKKIEELAFLFDFAFNNQWLFNELYDNYPFPGTNHIPVHCI